MRPDAASGLYEPMMVPFVQPVSMPAFAAEGQFGLGRYQSVSVLPAFSSLLGSAAPILPVAAAEPSPVAQPLPPGLAAMLLVAAEVKTSAISDGAGVAEESTASPVLTTPTPPAPTAADTSDPAPTPVAPDPSSAPSLPAVDDALPAPATVAPVLRDVAVDPVRSAGSVPTEAIDPVRSAGSVPAEAVDPVSSARSAPASPVDPMLSVGAVEAAAVELTDGTVQGEPIGVDPATRPIVTRTATAADPVADTIVATRDAALSPEVPQRPLEASIASASTAQLPSPEAPLEPNAPLESAPATPVGGLPVQQEPAELGSRRPERPCTLHPKTVAIPDPATPPDGPAADIAGPSTAAPSAPDAPSRNLLAPVAGNSDEPPAANDDSAVPDPAPVTISGFAPQAEPLPPPIAIEVSRPDAPAPVAAAPLPDSSDAEQAPGAPAAPTPRGGIPSHLATPVPQDVAKVGDTPEAPEASTAGHASQPPAQRTGTDGASATGGDGGESGRQPASTPVAAPAPAVPPPNAPVAFSRLVPDADPIAAAQPAEPRARAAAIGEDVAVAIVRHAAGGADDLLVIRLDPGELGRIEVRLKVEDGQRLSAELTADQPATLDLLRRDSDSLSRALNDAGFRTEGQSLRFDGRGTGQGGESGFGQQERRTAHRAYLGEDETAAPSASVHSPQVRSAGRIDLFA